MATLIKCPACKKDVSTKAESCPKCGHVLTAEEIEAGKKLNKQTKIGCLIIVVIILSIYFFSDDNKDTNQETQKQSIQSNENSPKKNIG